MIGSVLSDTKSLLYGVLKGSVLVPILYSLHTTPLSKVIQNHPFMLTTQLYVDLTHKNVTQAFNRLKTALIASKSGFLQISLSPDSKTLVGHRWLWVAKYSLWATTEPLVAH